MEGAKNYSRTYHIMKTFLTVVLSHSSPVVGSLIFPSGSPNFAANSSSLARPYILPFGKTTGSGSTDDRTWCAYGTFRARSLSSVEQIGQSEVVELTVLDDEDATGEWQDGVLRAERPAERAMWRRGREGRP